MSEIERQIYIYKDVKEKYLRVATLLNVVFHFYSPTVIYVPKMSGRYASCARTKIWNVRVNKTYGHVFNVTSDELLCERGIRSTAYGEILKIILITKRLHTHTHTLCLFVSLLRVCDCLPYVGAVRERLLSLCRVFVNCNVLYMVCVT